MTLRERLIVFLDELNNAAWKNNHYYYAERQRAYLDVGMDLKRILEEYPDTEEKCD